MTPIQLKVVNPLLTKWGTPVRATPLAAGYDLCACIERQQIIPADSTMKIPTGIALHINDPNITALIYPRSGLALNHGITLANAVGVIDADYQGEICVLIRNESWQDYIIRPGDRIAQMVFSPIQHPPVTVVVDFDVTTARGTNGFGSSGVSQPEQAELCKEDMGIA